MADDDYVYEPDSLVKSVSGFTSSDFDPEDDSYWESIAVLAGIAAVAGVGQMLLFFLWLCCRCLCSCCCKSPDAGASKGDVMTWRRTLFGMLLVTMVTGLAGLDGNSQVSTGMDDIVTALDLIVEDIETLEDASNSLSTIADDMDAWLRDLQSTCDDPTGETDDIFDDFYTMLADMSEGTTSFADDVGDSPDAIRDAQDGIDNFESYRELATAIPIAAVMLVSVLGFVGACCSSACALRLVTLLGMVALLACTFGVVVELPVSVVMADACMDPDQAILGYIDEGEAYDTMNYYLSCSGSNPVQESIDDVLNEVNNVTALIDDVTEDYPEFEDLCGSLTQLGTYADDAADIIQDVNDNLIDCHVLADPWRVGMHKGVCTEITPGLVKLWATTAACGQMLLFSLIVAAITWKRFGSASQEELQQKLVQTKFVPQPGQFTPVWQASGTGGGLQMAPRA